MTKQKLATLSLMLGMFFNPFGFDAIQIMLMNLTGSYYKANLVLYCLAAFCFGLYFYFSGSNPFITIKDIIISIYQDKIKNIFTKHILPLIKEKESHNILDLACGDGLISRLLLEEIKVDNINIKVK